MNCFVSDASQDVCSQGVQTFEISRVIGNGLSAADDDGQSPVTDTTGQLINPGQLVAQGLVSPVAHIGFETDSGGEDGGEITVFLNNVRIARFSVAIGSRKTHCISVPIERLRFAHRSNTASTLVKGVNRFVFRLNKANTGAPPVGEGNLVVARAIQVRFKAMSPVLLVHGIRDEGNQFSVPIANVQNSAFTDFLNGQRIGYYIFRQRPGAISTGHRLIPGAISEAQSQFGAESFHAVAWSKGGLWMRDAIHNSLNFPLITLLTLDTPHDGTRFIPRGLGFIGDYLDSRSLGAVSGLGARWVWLDELRDLHPEAVRVFTQLWKKEPHSYSTPDTGQRKSLYFSVTANADKNRNGIFEANEVVGFLGLTSEDILTASIGNFISAIFAGCNLRVNVEGSSLFSRLINASPIQCGAAIPNDLVVTQESARGGEQTFIPMESRFAEDFSYNHNTVVNGSIASRFFQLMRQADRVQ